MVVDITCKTDRFNLSVVGPDFINDCCFGEDFSSRSFGPPDLRMSGSSPDRVFGSRATGGKQLDRELHRFPSDSVAAHRFPNARRPGSSWTAGLAGHPASLERRSDVSRELLSQSPFEFPGWKARG
jgi:hypothetical protein